MALLGENGAGKSTLVKILAGLVSPDDGTIEIDGSRVELRSAARSREAGIAVVQQELSLVPTLTAAENVFLGSARGGVWAARRLAAEARPHPGARWASTTSTRCGSSSRSRWPSASSSRSPGCSRATPAS